MELDHFSHVHRLIYSEDELNTHEHEVICCGCKDPITGSSYSCFKCSFFLHKTCAELPLKIAHPAHRKHPLTLLMRTTYSSGRASCDLCEKSCENLVYHCSICQFDLHSQCALAPCVVGNVEHRFMSLIKSILFVCDGCGVEGRQGACLCVSCQIMVHRECVSLRRSIIISEHNHVMTHFYFLQENDESVKPCAICSEDLEISHGGYCCSVCDYVVHVNCAKQCLVEVEDEHNSLSINGLAIGSNLEKPDEKLVTGNEKFSHEHDLTMFDEMFSSCDNIEDASVIRANKQCDGCMLPLSPPFYGCVKCDVFLHKKCCELSAKIKHPLHQHILTLASRAPSVDGLFKCDACDQYCHGFCYHCEPCNFFIDLRCCDLSDTLQHHGHDHLLRLVTSRRNYACHCSACYGTKFTYFDCVECNFTLDFRCATLPQSVRHRFDETHPLKLTCNHVSNHSIEHYCDVCELGIDPGSQIDKCVPWFYQCKDCEISIHPECVLGKYPYIKFGGAYTYDFHPHPLSLVQRPFTLVPKHSAFVKNKKKKHHPPCDNCAEPFFSGEPGDLLCRDLALHCALCNYFIHRASPCFSH